MSPPASPDTPEQTFLGIPAIADALIDKLTLTCHLRFAAAPGCGLAELRGRLSAAGVISGGAGARAKIAFRWPCPRSGAVLTLGGSLTLAASAGEIVATSASRIDVSLLTMLRAQIYPVCEPALDGALNVVGPPEEDRPQLLGFQLETVAGLIDGFHAACSQAAGAPVSLQLWVRAAELNRDVPCAGASMIAHRLVGEANPWHRIGWARHYAGPADPLHDGNQAVVTWRNDRVDAPTRMKFYAKTADLLRIEVCYDNPASIRLGAGRGEVPWPAGAAANGAGVAERLAVLAVATIPVLDAMDAHVAMLGRPQRGVLELMVALAPLMRAGALPPRRRAGARPGLGTQSNVRDALYHLLVLGRFDASGLRTNGTVRKALDRIAAEGGLLATSQSRSALYTVPPDFAGARDAMRRALWPDHAGDRPPRRQVAHRPPHSST